MAYVNFSNATVVSTFTTPHSMNAWAYLDSGPWRKIQPITTDGTSNMFLLLNAAKAGGRPVSGSYDDSTGFLFTLYMV
jgi:hypothetical protein